MRSALVVAGASLRRMFRDRTALFFVVVLPVLIIAIIGTVVQSPGGFRLAVLGGQTSPLAGELVTELKAAGPVRTTADEATARTALRRGELDAVVLIPADLETAIRAGREVRIPVLAGGAESTQAAVRAAVAAAVARHAERLQAAAFAARYTGTSLPDQLPRATVVQQVTPRITVGTENVETGSDYLPLGFGYSAPTMLVLFVFINALAGGAAVIQTRRLGIYDRALAAPVRPGSVVLGEALCSLVFALLQSALIVAVGGLLFGVSWGDPPAAAALIGTWALVGAGAGMLSGALFKTPDQASAVGPVIGIAFAMLGGCMWPLAIVPDAVRLLGHVTPHAWAIDAWITVLSKGGGVSAIAAELGVLGLFAVVMLGLAALVQRRRLIG